MSQDLTKAMQEAEEGIRTWVTEATCTIVMHCPYCTLGVFYANHPDDCPDTTDVVSLHKCHWCKGTGTIPAASQNKEAIFND